MEPHRAPRHGGFTRSGKIKTERDLECIQKHAREKQTDWRGIGALTVVVLAVIVIVAFVTSDF